MVHRNAALREEASSGGKDSDSQHVGFLKDYEIVGCIDPDRL